PPWWARGQPTVRAHARPAHVPLTCQRYKPLLHPTRRVRGVEIEGSRYVVHRDGGGGARGIAPSGGECAGLGSYPPVTRFAGLIYANRLGSGQVPRGFGVSDSPTNPVDQSAALLALKVAGLY